MATTNVQGNTITSGGNVNMNTSNTTIHVYNGPINQSFPLGEPDLFNMRRDLLSACQDKDTDFAKELLKTNYFNFTAINYTNAEFSNNTALHLSAMSNIIPIVDKLLTHPMINVNARNDDGDTPLIIAARLGHIKVVARLLRKSGINLDIKNRDGQTALDEALKHRQMEVASLLEDYPHGGFDIGPEDTDTTFAPETKVPFQNHQGININALGQYSDSDFISALKNGATRTGMLSLGEGGMRVALPVVKIRALDSKGQNNAELARLGHGRVGIVMPLISHHGTQVVAT